MSSEDEGVVSGHAHKRRRLNPQVEPSSEQIDPASSSDSPNSLHEEHCEREESEPKQQVQKPRHRIHIVKNAHIPDDEFFTQAPTATDDPHRIRGAHWLKRQPLPQLEPHNQPQLQPTRPVSRNEPVPARQVQRLVDPPQAARGHVSVRASPPAEIVDLDLFDDIDDHEAALMAELADFPHAGISTLDRSSTNGDAAYARELASQEQLEAQRASRMAAPQSNLRQTTLFGGPALRDDGSATQASQSNRVRNWPAAERAEPPTHHKLDHEALQTCVYPTNLGTIRDYQYNIVLRGLYSNLLVALPTGLGKTFIAATIMLNWFRWTQDSQIVFVAPTRPLVAQQVDACFHIAGIPRSATTLLTGNIAPGLRAEEWQTKRVFFMTPQTIINDLKTGICDPKKIVLIVIDEAHRATGSYAYVEVVKFLRRFNTSFRVLALTATPGSTVESVQEVIDGLGIARTEIRTEESLDIRQYVHQRNIDTVIFDFNEEILLIMDLLSNAIKPVLSKLNQMNASWIKDPMALTAYGCTIARQKWMGTAGKDAGWGQKNMVNSIFSVLAGIAHAIELLKFHGIGPFYHKIQKPSNPDKKESKWEAQIREHADFGKMLSTIRAWVRHPDFLGHPKLEHLGSVVLNHFMDAGEGTRSESSANPAPTRVMIFAHYRDSAEEIVRVLNRNDPMVRAHVFVGQASTGGSEGMDQKKQQEIIEKFKKGTYNTLVATSIGEEGLDIGEVDLIICYDASASPIRMLQRMGRTGRKRAGNICVLLMKTKEQDNFEKAKDNYEKMQQMIAAGDRFQYHQDTSPRIVPKGTVPTVDKRVVEIPIENSQAELPEPKRKNGKIPKRPPKKFHMPDGVMTGFMKASEMGNDGGFTGNKARRPHSPAPDPVPDTSTVLLTESQNEDLESRFLYISGDQSEVVELPSLDKYPSLQRTPRPTKLVGHGNFTKRVIAMLGRFTEATEPDLFERNLHKEDRDLADRACLGQAPVELETHQPDISCSFDASSDDSSEIIADPVPKPTRKRKTPTKSAPKAKKAPIAKKSVPRKEPLAARKTATPKKQRRKRAPSPTPTPDPTQIQASSMDMGIDIMNTDDDNDRDEDDDNGSDLLDFIDDGAQADVVPSSSTDSLLSRPRRSNTPDRRQRNTVIQDDFDSDKENDSLPDIDELLKSSQPTTKKVRRRGRKVVVDSDEDE